MVIGGTGEQTKWKKEIVEDGRRRKMVQERAGTLNPMTGAMEWEGWQPTRSLGDLGRYRVNP